MSEPDGKAKRRLVDHPIVNFALQQIISTAGPWVAGTAISFGVAVISAALTRNLHGGDFIDHVVDQPSCRWVSQPYYPAIVIAGLLFGILSFRYFRSTALGAWVWVLPLLVLVWSILTWQTGGSKPYWPDVWNNYFGADCGSSECLHETFLTVPFYTSVVYSLGWLGCRVWSGRPA